MPFSFLFPSYFQNPNQAFIIWVDGADETSRALVGASLSYSFGRVGTLNISFESGVSIAFGTVIKIYDTNLNTFIFSGTVREFTARQQTHNRYIWDCVVHDFPRAVYAVTGITESETTATEKTIIQALWVSYPPSPTITVGSGVITGNTTTITFNNVSLGEALDMLAAANNRIWSVDANQELQYGSVTDWGTAAFNLSDSPDMSTSYPYHAFEYTQDDISNGTNQVTLKTYYSGLKVGTKATLTNSVIGAPFTGATYYITDISARLLNTIDTNIRWEFTVTLRNQASLPYIIDGYGNKDKFINRLRNVPDPTERQQPATKHYIDTRTRGIGVIAIDATTDVTVADGHAYIPIPAFMNGMNLTRAQAIVNTAGTTNPTTIDIYNVTAGVDMLSTAISIASGATVGTVGTINTANDGVETNDVLRVDVTTISTTAPKGLIIPLEFALP